MGHESATLSNTPGGKETAKTSHWSPYGALQKTAGKRLIGQSGLPLKRCIRRMQCTYKCVLIVVKQEKNNDISTVTV
jgi:hypothetical protein